MDQIEIFRVLGVSLLLGLLVGLQREYADSGLAGLRTFPLVTLLGSLAALLVEFAGGWAIAAGLVALAVVIGVANEVRSRHAHNDGGITTEVALLVMFLVGAYVVVGDWVVGVALGVAVAVLLQFKVELHGLVDRLGDADVRAVMTFALISGVVLPVLPNETFGPLDVLNPFEIWLMVVLIVGITLAGYACYKFFGERAGLLLGGVLGGAVSSTATVASYARRTREQPAMARASLIVVTIASAVVFVRVMIEIAAVSSQNLFPVAWPPLAILGAATLAPALFAFIRATKDHQKLPEQKNPTELKAAMVFAAIYAAVTLALAAAKEWLGDIGLYVVAVLSGLTDMDAITLSTARLVEHPESAAALSPDMAWRLIAVAAMSNLVFKGIMAATIGGWQFAKMVAAAFAVPLAVGAALVLAWPDWRAEVDVEKADTRANAAQVE
jgi:uncharacterized membrane protein (DUF4010 family)